MSSREEKDFESRRQQIIDGALQVFANKGFEKATNKEIAAAAGIGSPGLIYHYFKDKEDLFGQVVEQRMPLLQLLTHGEAEMMQKPLRDVLMVFGRSFLNVADNPMSITLMKLVLGEAFRHPVVAAMVNQIGPSRSIGFMTRYLAKQMADGVLKPMDPAAAARCFIGPFVAYLLTRELFHQPDAEQMSTETMVTTAVEIFLSGMQMQAEVNETSV